MLLLETEPALVARFGCRPSARLLGLALLVGIPVTIGGCGLEATPERFDGVDFTSSHVPVGELQDHALLMLLVQSEDDLPVVEVKITYPSGARTVGTPLRADDSWWREADSFLADRPWVEVKGGAIPPGEGGAVFIKLRLVGAREGDTLTFPVELTLEDGSIVEWTGPPGSERPAPSVVVGEPPAQVPAPVGLGVAGLALLVLLTSGGYMLRRHRSRSR